MEALSPLSVLTRGYGIAETAEHTVVRSVKDVGQGEDVTLRLNDGRLDMTVKEIHKEEKSNGKNSKKL
jgi:exodeoxyribonuclease VII large subunit